jgi:hypothetical protein
MAVRGVDSLNGVLLYTELRKAHDVMEVSTMEPSE